MDPVNGPEPGYDYLVQIRLKNIYELYVLWWSRTGPGPTLICPSLGLNFSKSVSNWTQRGPAACVLSPFHRTHSSSAVEMKVQVCSECESR